MLKYNNKNFTEPTVTLFEEGGIMAILGDGMDPKKFLISCSFELAKVDMGIIGTVDFIKLEKWQLEGLLEMYKCMQVNIAKDKEND